MLIKIAGLPKKLLITFSADSIACSLPCEDFKPYYFDFYSIVLFSEISFFVNYFYLLKIYPPH